MLAGFGVCAAMMYVVVLCYEICVVRYFGDGDGDGDGDGETVMYKCRDVCAAALCIFAPELVHSPMLSVCFQSTRL